MKFKFFCLLLMLFASFAAWSQKTVTGKVTKENGDPLAGATVSVKGSKTAATTKADGTFSIQVPSNTSKLVVSYVGNVPQEITVGTQTNVSVAMKEDATALTDVVVIGYATVKKKDLLASVSSISAKDLKDIPINNAAEALNGRLAGVTATTSEGSPDADIRIRVRGGISITGDNSPLYIVDGVVVENAFNTISPQDIQSIDVLKDAAATAIYGSRGANGVIVITTKSGKPGKLQVSYNGLFGVKHLANKLGVLNPYEYVVLAFERSRNSTDDSTKFRRDFLDTAQNPLSFWSIKGTQWDSIQNYNRVGFVDWQEELMGRTGTQQTHNITMSGGNKKATFSFGYTRNDDKAIVLNSTYERNLLNLKADYKITPKIKVAVGGRLNNQEVYGAGTSSDNTSFSRLRNAIKYKPFLSENQDVDDPDPLADPGVGNGLFLINPIRQANAEYRRKSTNAYNVNGYVQINLLKNLTFRSTVGYDFSELIDRQFSDSVTNYSITQGGKKPIISLDTTEKKGLTNSNVFSYSLKNYRNAHDFDVVLGQETVQNWFESFGRSLRDFDSTYPNKAFNDRAKGTLIPPARFLKTKATLLSFFGRVTYGYKDKYLFSANLRADGSSKFKEGSKWGYFPAGSIAWRIKKEKFMDNVDFINDWKIRAGFGTAGNNRILDYLFLTTFRFDQFLYGIDNQVVNAASARALANEKLIWEATVSRNLGMDFTLFNNRLDISLDYYKNSSKDLLLIVPISPTFGYPNQTQNVGETSSTGFEFQIGSTILRKRNNLTWSANFNMAFNKNEVENLGYQTEIPTPASWGVSGQPRDYVTRVGLPVGSMYGYVSDGFYKLEDFIYNTTTTDYNLRPGVADMNNVTGNVVPGGIKFKDISGPNGRPDSLIDDFDKTIIGNPTPKFTGGLSQQFTYKQWDASVFINFSYGNDVYNANKIELTNIYSVNSNVLDVMQDRWRTVDANGNVVQRTRTVGGRTVAYGADPSTLGALNANAKIWMPIRGNGAFFPHSWAIEDGSFIRLNNVTIGYSFPIKSLVKLRMSKLRLYVTGNNLAIITNYTGYDPEVSVRSSPLTPGLDHSSYPKSRSYIVGVNLTF